MVRAPSRIFSIWRTFPFVHKDILGEEPYTEVKDYNVEVSADVVTVTNYRAYQPRANAASSESVDVEYTYRVLRPLTVMLTKEPGAEGEKPADIILMSIQPKTQESIRVWFVLGMNYGEDMPTSYFSEFQDRIFFQDKDILESQRPICLPLESGCGVPSARGSNIVELSALAERHGAYLRCSHLISEV